jgi:hypothetical protein
MSFTPRDIRDVINQQVVYHRYSRNVFREIQRWDAGSVVRRERGAPVALVVCIVCKRAFINGQEKGDICPDCTTKLQEIYPVVRNFLRDHEKESYTVYDISRIFGIPPRNIEALVSAGMIDAVYLQRTLPEKSRKGPKIMPLDPESAKEILKGDKSSMHTYAKKKRGEEEAGNKRNGDKKQQ